jgi:hypothetical protein
MLVKNVIRGNSVTFTSAFMDANNTIMTPASPSVTLYYKSNNQYVSVSLDMEAINASSWSASWNSSNADVGVVQWHISAGNATPVAMDGDFRILSNKANGGPGAT